MDTICGNCVYYRATNGENGYCIMEELNVTRTRQACYDAVRHGRMKSSAEPIKEPKPQKAYVIVSGEYSDFGINAVFLDKCEAERAVEIANRRDPHNDYRIQEWPIGLSFNPETDSLYFVSFYKGAVDEVKQQSTPFLTTIETNVVSPWNVYKYKDGKYYEHRMYVYARDEEHAKKKAADIFAKWKAEQEGIT